MIRGAVCSAIGRHGWRVIGSEDGFDGIGYQVAQQISDSLSMETRVVTLGHLQRGGSTTHYDRILASRFGVKAVELHCA